MENRLCRGLGKVQALEGGKHSICYCFPRKMEGVSSPTTLAPIHSENSLTLSNFKLFRKNPCFEEITISRLGVQKGGQPTKVGQSICQQLRASGQALWWGRRKRWVNHTEPRSSKEVQDVLESTTTGLGPMPWTIPPPRAQPLGRKSYASISHTCFSCSSPVPTLKLSKQE